MVATARVLEKAGCTHRALPWPAPSLPPLGAAAHPREKQVVWKLAMIPFISLFLPSRGISPAILHQDLLFGWKRFKAGLHLSASKAALGTTKAQESQKSDENTTAKDRRPRGTFSDQENMFL